MKILTFDVEDWFHILDNNLTKSSVQWSSFESRIKHGMEIVFDIINNSNTPATFFVVGWIAEKYPDLVKRISDSGFEVGSHTHLHQLVYQQTYDLFYNDVEKSIKTIEDITGKKVRSFRAPGFSITTKNLWAFDALHSLGIEIDSSIFPASRAHGGMKKFIVSKPSIIKYNGIKLKEFPINTQNILGYPFIFSGGGYFRLFPYRLIKKFTDNSDYIMTYFHPRDFDINQPLIPGLSISRKFKSYVGIKKCKSKLLNWLEEYSFIDINQADEIVEWREAPTINLNQIDK